MAAMSVLTVTPPASAELGLPVAGNASVVASKQKFSAGRTSTCVVRDEGYAVCWGLDWLNSFGTGWRQSSVGVQANQLGGNLKRTVPISTDRTTYTRTKAVYAGPELTCLLDLSSNLYCTGYDSGGALGRSNPSGSWNNSFDQNSRVNLGTGRTVVDMATGGDSSSQNSGHFNCALLDNGSVKCWGNNGYGRLGLGDTSNRGDQAGEMGDSLPAVNLGTGVTATAIAAGWEHACAIVGGGSVPNGSVKCWGANSYGELGQGDTANRGDGANEMGDNLPAVNLGTGRTAKFIATGRAFSCAIRDDNSVVCWGWNLAYQAGRDQALTTALNEIGNAANEMGDNLVAVNLGQGATQLALGNGFACALLADASVKCWGGNWNGQLGQGNTTNRGNNVNPVGTLSPVQLGLNAGEQVSAIDSGGDHVCVYTSSSRVKCWGSNDGGYGNGGQLGIGQANTVKIGDAANEMGSNLAAVDFAATSPTEVTNVTSSGTSSSVTFSWGPPTHANGTITAYEAQCGANGSNGSTWNGTNNGWTSLGMQQTVTVTSTVFGAVSTGTVVNCDIRARTISGTTGEGMSVNATRTAGPTLTVTASSHTVNPGDPVPTITGSPSVTGVSRTGESCTTTYTTSSSVGSYPTTCSGGTAAGYVVEYSPGSVTVVHPAPTVSAVSPTSGSTLGGATLTLTGTGFRSGAAVTVGGAACLNVVVVGLTSITCESPVGSGGSASVVVTNTDAQANLANALFTYVGPSISPTNITVSGTAGTAITSTAGFTSAQLRGAVTFSATGLPAGLSIDANTGVISGTPSGASTATATVTATGATAGSASTSVTFAIVAAPTTTTTPPSSSGPSLVNSSNQSTLTRDPGAATAIVDGQVVVPTVEAPADLPAAQVDPQDRTPAQVQSLQTVADDLVGQLNQSAGGNSGLSVQDTPTGANINGLLDVPVPIENTVLVEAADKSTLFAAVNEDGTVTEVEPGAVIEVLGNGEVGVAAFGLTPNEAVEFVVMSTPTLLGSYTVNADGTVKAQAPLPSTVGDGNHTLVVASPSVKASLGLKIAPVTPGVLPTTGTDPWSDSAVAALWLVVLGSIVGYSRRRRLV